ncbi:hypothetical protein ACQEVX_24070 [Streptomyces syringium]|uniref:hypothetical protein n=1 Tax=Streptomyces syringium TaxID=76729 RepID=UPI003D92E317
MSNPAKRAAVENEGDFEDVCRICGYSDGGTFREDGWPVGTICDCCGTQAGIGDTTLEQVREIRAHWVKQGAQWWAPKHKPENWDPDEQLSNLPLQWR